jgi:hypothetical protein
VNSLSLSLHQSPSTAQHYTLFPLALGQILRQYAVTELHLTLNAGKWDYDKWGVPDDPGVGTGAELWVWMVDNASAQYVKSFFEALRIFQIYVH